MFRSVFYLLFLFAVIPGFTDAGWAQEFFSGRILEVDKARMEFVMTRDSLETMKTEGTQRISVRIAEQNRLPIHEGRNVFPRCVSPGSRIRIWGYWKKDSPNVLMAHNIKGCDGGGCADPTGIMSRLKRAVGAWGRRHGKKNIGSEQEIGVDGEAQGGSGSGSGGGSGGGSGSGSGSGSGGGAGSGSGGGSGGDSGGGSGGGSGSGSGGGSGGVR